MKWNLIANAVGQFWRAAMLLAFVPVYIQFLGIEAYGLIGLLALLQMWLSLLDFGLRPALSREMARYLGGGHDAASIWRLLRTIELIALGLAAAVTFVLLLGSHWLAEQWVQPERLTQGEVARAFAIMGFVAALYLLESVYVSAIIGLQRQVLQNIIGAVSITVRSVGAVAVLHWVSPTIDAFFLWQGFASVLAIFGYAALVYRSLPPRDPPPRFSLKSLVEIRRYAFGMVGISLLSLVLMQFDKVILSRQLSLSDYGYYILAGAVSGALSMASTPIGTAFFPRMVQLIERKERDHLASTFHQGAQILTLLVGAAAIVIGIFARPLLEVWTGDPVISANTEPLLRALVIAAALNAATSMPYLLQLAFGWTSLAIRINSVACIFLVVTLFLVVPTFGAIGAAWTLVAVNVGSLTAAALLTFPRFLPGELRRWALLDILLPLVAMAACAVALNRLIPLPEDRIGAAVFLVLSGVLVFALGCLFSPVARHFGARALRGRGGASTTLM